MSKKNVAAWRLPGDIGGDGWMMEVDEGQHLKIHWGDGDGFIHVTTNGGEPRFVVEVTSWNADMSFLLQKVTQIVSEQLDHAAPDREIKLTLEATY